MIDNAHCLEIEPGVGGQEFLCPGALDRDERGVVRLVGEGHVPGKLPGDPGGYFDPCILSFKSHDISVQCHDSINNLCEGYDIQYNTF